MIEKYRKVCEHFDWTVHEYADGTVELEKYSPAGEDFVATVNVDGFVDNVKAYAADFDPDEHIEMWIMARHNGARNVPSARELVHDAEAIDEMLQEMTAALQEAEYDNNCTNGIHDCETCSIRDACTERGED